MGSETGVRRSSRLTKGKNTRLSYEEELELEQRAKDDQSSALKKRSSSEVEKKGQKKAKSTTEKRAEELDQGEEHDQPTETVKCLVCGTTDANYNEDTDPLGLMVECSKCKTWQHSICLLGHKNVRKVPKDYTCNACSPEKYPNLQPVHTTPSPDPVVSLESKLSFNKTRFSVAKTFHTLFSTLLQNFEKDKKARDRKSAKKIEELGLNHAIELEQLVFNNYAQPNLSSESLAPGHKYSEKARSLYANLKDSKNILYRQVCEGKLSMNELSLLSPQELLNPDLQKFSKQVLQQLIHDSVLKPLQKPTFKKTHKGDEMVENDENSAAEIEIGGVGRVRFPRDSKRLSSEDSQEAIEETNERGSDESRSSRRNSGGYDPIASTNDAKEPALGSGNGHTAGNGIGIGITGIDIDDDNDNGPVQYEDVGLDGDLDDILNDNNKIVNSSNSDNKLNSKPSGGPGPLLSSSGVEAGLGSESINAGAKDASVGPFRDVQFWKGELTFPGICNFESNLRYLSSTEQSQSFAKQLEVMQKTMASFSIQNYLEIEGRLNADKLIQYLTKILSTRSLSVCKLTYTKDLSNFQRLYQYFQVRNKIGVIGNRPSFVKDCYLFTVDKDFIEARKSAYSNVDHDGSSLDFLLRSLQRDIFQDLQLEETILLFFVLKPESPTGHFQGTLGAPAATTQKLSLKTLPRDFYKLNSANQLRFMEIVQMREQRGDPLGEVEIEGLVKSLL